MKTYFKDYSLANSVLTHHEDRISDVMNERQTLYEQSTEYLMTQAKVKKLLIELGDQLPSARTVFNQLADSMYELQCLCFRAGYKAGIADLITAMTFNSAGITKVEFVDVRQGEEAKRKHLTAANS